MNLFDNIYCFLYNFFEILTIGNHPIHDETKDDDEEYEFVSGGQVMNRS